MITPTPDPAHRITWWVWAGKEKLRKNAQMRGFWGYDVSCSCGWETRTGGATRRAIQDEIWLHKWGTQ